MRRIAAFMFFFMSFMAFPQVFDGAYGWGSNWNFSGYTVRKVTNLNNSGAGSLRAAATQTNSLIVFEVAGTIGLQSGLAIASNVYIAGQTAFRYGGGGINITKAGNWGPAMITTTSNTIIRYINLSGWPNTVNCCSDVARLSGTNVIWDHVTVRGGSDEGIDLYNVQNLTLQYCIFSYSLQQNDPDGTNGASRGMLGAGVNNATFLGNFFAENNTRNPLVGGDGTLGRLEFYNNVIFAASSMGFEYRSGTEGNINVVGNYVKRGKFPQPARSRFNYNVGALPSTSRLYAHNNIDTGRRTSLADPEINVWSSGGGSSNSVPMPSDRMTNIPHDYPLYSTYTAKSPFELREKVLNHAGNSIKRDPIDIFLLNEFDNNRGISFIPPPYDPEGYFADYNPSRTAMSGVEADTDADGIPNSLEAIWGNDTFGYVNSLVAPKSPPDPPVTSPDRQRKQSAAANILLFTQQKN